MDGFTAPGRPDSGADGKSGARVIWQVVAVLTHDQRRAAIQLDRVAADAAVIVRLSHAPGCRPALVRPRRRELDTSRANGNTDILPGFEARCRRSVEGEVRRLDATGRRRSVDQLAREEIGHAHEIGDES